MEVDVITLIRFEDWEAMYINGFLVYENHKVRVEDILPVLSTFDKLPTIHLWDAHPDDNGAVNNNGCAPLEMTTLHATLDQYKT